jgi:hypothetical protein
MELFIKLILTLMTKKRKLSYLKTWREQSLRDFYTLKLQNAASMVDKMSKFSRSFIALNSLSQIVLKNKQRVMAKALSRWGRITSQISNRSAPSQTKTSFIESQ